MGRQNVGNQSLNSIMNEMARRQDVLSYAVVKPSKKLEPLSELEAFAVLDDTLEALYKQYLDAKAQRKELVLIGGADDAMASVAMDMEDSAWCAMQTRYIELRKDGLMMKRAQKMRRQRDLEIQEQEEVILQNDKIKQARDFANYLKILKIMKQKNKTPRIFEWLFVFLLLNIDIFGQNTYRKSYGLSMAS